MPIYEICTINLKEKYFIINYLLIYSYLFILVLFSLFIYIYFKMNYHQAKIIKNNNYFFLILLLK